MRRFVVLGREATASPDFQLDNLAASSGRLDVLLRCIRAALLYSRGLRRDTIVYLVLLGGRDAPRTLRIDGPTAKFLRPDERSLAILVQKALAQPLSGPGFTTLRHGLAVAPAGLDAVLDDLGPSTHYLLEEGAPDLRGLPLDDGAPVFYLGDHLGLDEAARATLARVGARPVSVGPVSVHADDAVALAVNELDRRDAAGPVRAGDAAR